MLFTIIKPRVTPRQKAIALALASCADLLQIVVWPLFAEGFLSPFEDLLDVIVAGALIAVCGFRWQFVLAFFLETVPGFDLFPTWTALVLSLPVTATDVQRFNVRPGTWQTGDASPAGGSPMNVACGPTSVPAKPPGATHAPINVRAVAIPPVQASAQQGVR